jgi:lipopolysaccharide export system permease protein
MINIQFLPSKRLAWYLARTFLLRSLAVMAALVVILQTLDLLGESGKILAQPGNGDAQLWHYVGLRVPQLIERFLPFSVLLGTLITLATLNQHSEVIAMKAAGISAHQIIAPLVVTSFLIGAASFIFNERVVTRSTATLNAWTAVEYGQVPADSGVMSNVWARHGNDLVLVGEVRGRGDGVQLRDVTIYQREGGILRGKTEAESGSREGGGWLLRNVRTFVVDGERSTQAAETVALSGMEPDQFTLSRVDADEQDFFTLRQSIEDMRVAGRETTALEAGLWHKIAGPFSSVLMPLLAAVAAFGLARSGQLFIRAVIGMFLGFAYFVVDNFALAMGNLGAYPPLLAAWGPFFLFLLIGETVLIRTEE